MRMMKIIGAASSMKLTAVYSVGLTSASAEQPKFNHLAFLNDHF
jgi:hypothetical protein